MIGLLLLVCVLLTAAALALGTLPEPARPHRCRTPYEDDEQAAILSGRAILEPQEQSAVHRGGL